MKTFDEALSVVMLPVIDSDTSALHTRNLVDAHADILNNEMARDYLSTLVNCLIDCCRERQMDFESMVLNIAVNSFAGRLRVGQEMEKGNNGPSE